ncbi:hypothetical protein PAXRUDRAFT_116353, partial [Paxillus rubicundulus Ve08.2h10]
TDRHFHHRLHNANPIILLSMFVALILNVFGHVTHPWCNTTLALLNILLKRAFHNDTHSTTMPTVQPDNVIPQDIHTVHTKFKLESITKIYTTCVRYCSTYMPDGNRKKAVYP